MSNRLDPGNVEPQPMAQWERPSNAKVSSLDAGLVELVAIRASRTDGCVDCANRSARHSERERAALGWTDALTRPCDESTHEGAYAALKEQFTQQERVKLTLAIVVINDWNRVAVGGRDFVHPAATGAEVEATAVKP